ncbi:MAG: hypothetical protein KF851_16335 [Pirellulaceae bacterium]|nr:hypothetical protein [Pirellulaceae bacterium]
MIKYKELKNSGLSTFDIVKNMFREGTGRLELARALEVVENQQPLDAKRIVTKALADFTE